MPLSKTTQLDERIFRCAVYSWTVKIQRTTTLPPEDPIFSSPEDAWAYFKQIKRVFTVIDENVQGSEKTFDSWPDAWKEYCKTVMGYFKFFPMLDKQPGNELYEMRYDPPNPLKEEPA